MSPRHVGWNRFVVLVMVQVAVGWRPLSPARGLDVPEPLAPVFVRGDADMSGSITLGDAIVVLRYLFAGGPPAPCLKAADLDDSGHIDLSDAVITLCFLFNNGPIPEPPFPRCGVDATPDRLGCGDHVCELSE